MMNLSELINPASVILLTAREKFAIIDEMIDHATAAELVDDPEKFRNGILEREKIISTGIGLGIALPHIKLPQQKNFFILIGLTGAPVEWDAIDRLPVRIVFMIGGPDYEQKKYLEILSAITQVIREPENRERFLNGPDATAVAALFKNV